MIEIIISVNDDNDGRPLSIILMIASSIRKKNKHDHALSKYMKGMDRVRRIERRHAKFKTRVTIMGNKEVSRMARRNSDKAGESKVALSRKKDKLTMKWRNLVPEKIFEQNDEYDDVSEIFNEASDAIQHNKDAKCKESRESSLCQSFSSTSLPSLQDIPDNQVLTFDTQIGGKYRFDGPQQSCGYGHYDKSDQDDFYSVSVAMHDGNTSNPN